MTTGASASNGHDTKKTNTWSAKRWLGLFGAMLLIWALLYLICHSGIGIKGYEHARFTDADIRHINSILVNPVSAEDMQYSDFSAKQRVTNTNDGFLDTYPADTTELVPYISEYPETTYINNTSDEYDRRERVRKAMVYISSQYGNEIDEDQMSNIQRYINTFSPRETGIFLADYNLKVRSFFWKSGPLVYAELVFWAIFGVLCSLLLFTGNLIRKNSDNAHREILSQAARLLYAPFAGIIILLAFNYLRGAATLHIRSGEGVIVFAFLLGFYSGTVMELLDRARNILFNNGQQPQPTPVVQTVQPELEPEPEPQPVGNVPVQEPVPHEEETADDNYFDKYYGGSQGELLQDEQVTKTANLNENNELEEVDIDLKLDFSGLFDEERTELQKMGFSKAIVTLHNVNGKDIIPAKKLNEDMTTFVASGVRPGIYIARATLSQRLRDDNIINLFGEKTAYITEDKPGLELYVKKYEATD